MHTVRPAASVRPSRASRRWWQDAASRDRVLLVTFATLALTGILYPAFTNYLFAGDRRVLVVTMAQDAGQEARQTLKDTCGSLPGISLVADQGNPDPRIQGRFPVRFDIAGTTPGQQTALEKCISDNSALGVRGFLVEGDAH